MPYQTLITSILHQYVSGDLKPTQVEEAQSKYRPPKIILFLMVITKFQLYHLSLPLKILIIENNKSSRYDLLIEKF